MKKGTLSHAIGEINPKHISEAMEYEKSNRKVYFYKKYLGETMIAALLCIFILLGIGAFYSFNIMTIKAYAYETNEKIGRAGTVLSAGKVNNNGSMTGTPLKFYIQGKNIKTIRYSVKNQWIDFVDWTKKREEYGVAKNFTVSYGSNESDYDYLVINWEPNELWQAISDKNIAIIDLSQELREDIIVMEISFMNGKTETKAVKIKLQDNGTFVASFDNYSITKQDDFVKRPDSKPIDRNILYDQSSDAGLDGTTKEPPSYQKALTADEIKAAKAVALDYYKNTVWTINNISVTEDTNIQYTTKTMEAEYNAGNIIIFDVVAVRNNEVEKRTISVARKDIGKWFVINEGF